MFIIISGPSGAGKTPITYTIMDTFDNVKRIQSYTTRKERTKEVSGTYIYMTQEQFEKKIKEGFFLEYNKVHKDQQYYGTGLDSYLKIVGEGCVAIKDIDVDSYKKIKDSDFDVVGIYLTVQNRGVLFDRLRERGESENTINIRLHDRVDYENAQKDHYDYIVYTDNFEKAQKEVIKLLKTNLKNVELNIKNPKLKNMNLCFKRVAVSPPFCLFNNLETLLKCKLKN